MFTAATRANNPRVLIIEDQLDAQDSLRVLLAIHGCEVRVAADAQEAVRQTVGWRPEVVISDIGLPDLDGWQLGKQIRAGLGESAFLVAVTGHGDPASLQRSHEAGFNAHLTKPTDLKALLRLIGM